MRYSPWKGDMSETDHFAPPRGEITLHDAPIVASQPRSVLPSNEEISPTVQTYSTFPFFTIFEPLN